MQSLIRSKSAGVTGGRGTAGAGPGRDLLYKKRPLNTPQSVLPITPSTECSCWILQSQAVPRRDAADCGEKPGNTIGKRLNTQNL